MKRQKFSEGRIGGVRGQEALGAGERMRVQSGFLPIDPIARRWVPKMIVSDNGMELTSNAAPA